MTVTIDRQIPAGVGAERWEWSSDLGGTPTFYIYQDGSLIRTTQSTAQVFRAAAGETLSIEILDSASETPETAFPGRLTLSWEASTAVNYYLVEEFVASAWVERSRVADTAALYYSWQTRYLEDVTVHQFRITPIGTNGNTGAARVFSCLMVRHPDEPAVDYTYAAGTGRVTVSAAT